MTLGGLTVVATVWLIAAEWRGSSFRVRTICCGTALAQPKTAMLQVGRRAAQVQSACCGGATSRNSPNVTGPAGSLTLKVARNVVFFSCAHSVARCLDGHFPQPV